MGFWRGIMLATFWNFLNLFVTHLIQARAGEFWILTHTGHVRRPDTLMVFVGGVAHILLIISYMARFLRMRPRAKHWGQFFAGGLPALAYLGLIVVATLRTRRRHRYELAFTEERRRRSRQAKRNCDSEA